MWRVASHGTGRCPTYVNAAEIDSSATLAPGDTVLLQGELLLVAVLRPRITEAAAPVRFPP